MRRLDPHARRLGRVRRPVRALRRRVGVDGAEAHHLPRAGRRAARRVRRRAASSTPRTSATCSSAPFFCGCEADDPMTVDRVQHQGQPVRRALQRHVRLRHLALGRARHGRRARRGVRDGRARPLHRRRPPRLRVHQPGALLHARQPRLLRRHRGRGRGRTPNCTRAERTHHARSRSSAAPASSTAPARRRSPATSACATVASSPSADRSGRRRRAGARTVDADGLVRRARLHRHPHALRRPGALGSRAHARRRCTASPPSSAATAASRSRRSRPSTSTT